MLHCSMSYFSVLMLHLETPDQARSWCAAQRDAGSTIGFVPTMGALHQGHLSLLDRARRENTVCCVSIFVNPLQFEDRKDFSAYPRDLEADLSLLEDHGCDMVFRGTLEQFFPEIASIDDIEILPAGRFGHGLEEEFRPGHLDGVRTIVNRLFKVVGPGRAYFGEKDFQQTLVVSDLAEEMGYPEVIVCPTVRERSGLALSSRNALLSSKEKTEAEHIYAALQAAAHAWANGERSAQALRREMESSLAASNLQLEYAAVRDPLDWTEKEPSRPLSRAQALIAARLGPVRLIDNLRLDRSPN